MDHGSIFRLHVIHLMSVCLVCVVCLTSAATLEDERRLRWQIFVKQAYNPGIRPLLDQSNRIVVQSHFTLQHIHKLDDVKQSFETAGWLTLSWTDELMLWNPCDYDGIEKIFLSPKEIWKPDIELENGVNGYKRVGDDNQLIRVTGETGTVLWTPGDVYETGCSVDVTFYPFDVQSCSIRYGSWMYDESLLELYSIEDVIIFSSFAENGQWTVINSSSSHFTEAVDGVYLPFMEFNISIARKHQYYVISTIIPIFVMSLMSMIVFLLPPESGEKMTLSITVLLSLTVLLPLISETMPKTSKSLSLLAVYLVLVLVVDALSVMLSAAVLHFFYKPRDDSAGRSHDIIGSSNKIAPSSTEMNHDEHREPDNNCESMSVTEGKQKSIKARPDGVAIAKMIDRIPFVVLGMIVLIAMVVLGFVIVLHKA